MKYLFLLIKKHFCVSQKQKQKNACMLVRRVKSRDTYSYLTFILAWLKTGTTVPQQYGSIFAHGLRKFKNRNVESAVALITPLWQNNTRYYCSLPRYWHLNVSRRHSRLLVSKASYVPENWENWENETLWSAKLLTGTVLVFVNNTTEYCVLYFYTMLEIVWFCFFKSWN